MTPAQFRSALDRLGLTQAQAAELFDISLLTSHGYANGEPIPQTIAMLLQLNIPTLLRIARVAILA